MSASGSSTHLALFAKYWESGHVKTRLAASVGDSIASAIYREFLGDFLQRFRRVGDRRTLVFWPPDRQSEFEEFVPKDWHLAGQAAGDLGAKLSNFFQTRLSSQAERVVVIGADSPDLPEKFIVEAFELLDTHEVVLGPSADGGYYLVGQKSFVPVFDNITWSSSAVFEQTVAQLHSKGIRFKILKSWADVDDWPGLISLQKRLQQNGADPDLCRLNERLQTILRSVPS